MRSWKRDGRRSHPLYSTWSQARLRKVICDLWLEHFHEFAKEVGEKPARHRLERLDRSQPLGPGNWYWRPPVADAPVYPDRVAYNKLHYAKNKQYHRNKHYTKKYGITADAFDAMLRAQAGKCAICGGAEYIATGGEAKNHLSVDHCHTTGKVRGLLCNACNTSIGKMADDPARLRAAADYVESHRT